MASLGPGGTRADTLSVFTPEALIGRWSRIVTSDGADAGVVTQTTWHFADGGQATRTITSRTALGAILRTSTTHARWSASVGVLLLDFGKPSLRLVRVPYAIDVSVRATTLVLDGVPYLRVDS